MKKKIGNWTYSKKNKTITYKSGYEIDLERNLSTEEWLMHLQPKLWITSQDLEDLQTFFTTLNYTGVVSAWLQKRKELAAK